jgi:hypothetical protein
MNYTCTIYKLLLCLISSRSWELSGVVCPAGRALGGSQIESFVECAPAKWTNRGVAHLALRSSLLPRAGATFVAYDAISLARERHRDVLQTLYAPQSTPRVRAEETAAITSVVRERAMSFSGLDERIGAHAFEPNGGAEVANITRPNLW